jgi:hypothetical protein
MIPFAYFFQAGQSRTSGVSPLSILMASGPRTGSKFRSRSSLPIA